MIKWLFINRQLVLYRAISLASHTLHRSSGLQDYRAIWYGKIISSLLYRSWSTVVNANTMESHSFGDQLLQATPLHIVCKTSQNMSIPKQEHYMQNCTWCTHCPIGCYLRIFIPCRINLGSQGHDSRGWAPNKDNS